MFCTHTQRQKPEHTAIFEDPKYINSLSYNLLRVKFSKIILLEDIGSSRVLNCTFSVTVWSLHVCLLYDVLTRLSTIHRYDCSRAAGPRNLSPCHQYDGHAVLQHAHRMHSYKPSYMHNISNHLGSACDDNLRTSFARSSTDCLYWSFPASDESFFFKYGSIEWYCS